MIFKDTDCEDTFFWLNSFFNIYVLLHIQQNIGIILRLFSPCTPLTHCLFDAAVFCPFIVFILQAQGACSTCSTEGTAQRKQVQKYPAFNPGVLFVLLLTLWIFLQKYILMYV